MKKAPLKVGVTPQPVEAILPTPRIQLSLEERAVLRAAFESTAFKKAWHNAKLQEPGCIILADLGAPNGGTLALNRIHQMQGWKLFEVALTSQVNDPVPPRRQVEENYPEGGLEIVDPRKLPKPPPPPPAPLYVQPKPKK